MMRQGGFLVSFEGSEGSGKTTQIHHLAEHLEGIGRETVTTREPGGTPIGEQIRKLLKYDDCALSMQPETELLLFAASRAQLVREVIEPAVAAGKIVLCDRYLDSTTVYQGVARQISSEPVEMINRFAVGDRVPDLTVVIDVPAEVGLKRARARGKGKADRMEQESIDFYQSVREGYLVLAKGLPDRFVVVDGTQAPEAIAGEIWEYICKRFKLTKGE